MKTIIALSFAALAACAPSTQFSCDNPSASHPSCSECLAGCSDDDVRASCEIWSNMLYAEPCRPGDATCTVRWRDGRVSVWHFYDPYPRDEARELCLSVADEASVVFEEHP